MSAEWADWHGGLETDLYLLAEAVYPQLAVLDEQITEWARGEGDPRKTDKQDKLRQLAAILLGRKRDERYNGGGA
jgi:succinate dehydrogenase flavin-adding protein (antitoxin of CptAB toxin-antitoxin module)